MNLIEAAVQILGERPGQSMQVEELTRQVVERDLLSKPVKNPLRGLKAQLTTEAKKGDDSRVVKSGDDLWQLRGSADVAEPVAEAEIANLASPGSELERASQPPSSSLASPGSDEVAPEAIADAPPLDPAEAALADLYAEELAPVELAAAFPEYRDGQTADEDRPMMPEIVAPKRERFGRFRDRHRRRDERKGDRDRGRNDAERSTRGPSQPAAPRPGKAVGEESPSAAESPRPVAAERRPALDREPSRPAPPDRVAAEESDRDPASTIAADTVMPDLGVRLWGNSMGDGAVQALATIKPGQVVPVLQLAQMMRKRRLLEGSPEEMAPFLKIALINDERSHLDHGLRPRIVHRGRDLFSMVSTDDEMSAAERALAHAATALAAAAHQALLVRLRSLALSPLQRLVHLYLLRTGWTRVDWIKRVGPAGYGLARSSSSPDQPVLIGVRADRAEVPRGGVGELRAGVEAKKLDRGLLVAPYDLSEAARIELAKDGRPIDVLCGDRMAQELRQAGVGVVAATVPVWYLDRELWNDLANP